MHLPGDRHLSIRGLISWRIAPVVGLLLLIILFPSPGNEGIYVALCAILFAVLVILQDWRGMTRDGKIRSWLIPCFLAIGIFEPWTFSYSKGGGILSWGAWLIFALYYANMPQPERLAFWRRVKPLGRAVAFFMVAVLVGFMLSPDFRLISMSQWLIFATFFNNAAFFMLAALYCRSLLEVRRLGWASVVVGSLQAPIAFAQYNYIGPILDRLMAIGLIGNPYYGVRRVLGTLDIELTAEYMVLMILLNIILFRVSRTILMRLLSFFLFGTFVYTGMATGTRAFVIGLGFVPILVFLIAVRQPSGKKSSSLLLGLIFVLLTALVVERIVPDAAFAQMAERFAQIEPNLLRAWERSRGFQQAFFIQMTLEAPLTGQGLLQGVNVVSGAFWEGTPHSLYIWTWMSLGILGLLALGALLIGLLIRAFNIYMTAHSWPEMRLWGVFFLLFMFWFVIDQAKIEAVRQVGYVHFFFTWFGVISSCYVISQEKLQTGVSIARYAQTRLAR
jgi:O-antigen ligase